MIDLVAISPALRDPTVFATFVQKVLDATVWLNEQTLRAFPRYPRLYYSGVRFQPEPDGYESIVDCVQLLKVGHGDCAHLCAWRVAELRVRDQNPATVRLIWTIKDDTRMFHVMVRHADGTVEDPSKVLGMGHR